MIYQIKKAGFGLLFLSLPADNFFSSLVCRFIVMAATALLFFGTIAIEVFQWYRKEKLMDGPVCLSQLT